MSNPVIHMPSGSPALPPARLIFGVDATASREPTWNIARDLQAKMFIEAGANGRLNLQLVFYGGGSCRTSKWASRGDDLARWMGAIHCEAGPTMIEKVLRHALCEHEKAPMQGLTFIGDAQEENLDVLAGLADELGTAGVPLHMYQEGNDDAVRKSLPTISPEDRRHLFRVQFDCARNNSAPLSTTKRSRPRCRCQRRRDRNK